MELTQEQIDALVAERIAEAKKGLYTEEDLNKKVTSEVDRRVDSGIQKGLETQKKKWEDEFSAKAKLTAEEIAQKEIEEARNTLTAKEKEILKKENLIEAKEMLSGAEIPKSHYEKIITMLVSDDSDTTKANVQNFIDVFKETKTEIETKVKTELSKVPAPSQGKGELPKTKADFDKMSYLDKIKLKTESPELYKEFMKV